MVEIIDRSDRAKVLVKAAADTAAATELAVPFGRAVRRGDVLVLGTRPEEWLLFADPVDLAEPFSGADALADSVPRQGFVSTVDWTHSRGALRITGQQAGEVLGKVCNLDFTESMMPNGAVVSGRVASIGVDMARDDVRASGSAESEAPTVLSYLLLFDRSFGRSLNEFLSDAAAEFA